MKTFIQSQIKFSVSQYSSFLNSVIIICSKARFLEENITGNKMQGD